MSLYCDFYENGFYRPSELFNKTLASQALTIARSRWRIIKEFSQGTPKLQKLKKRSKEEFHKLLKETGAPTQVLEKYRARALQ